MEKSGVSGIFTTGKFMFLWFWARLLLCGRYKTDTADLERVDAVQAPNVHLKVISWQRSIAMFHYKQKLARAGYCDFLAHYELVCNLHLLLDQRNVQLLNR